MNPSRSATKDVTSQARAPIPTSTTEDGDVQTLDFRRYLRVLDDRKWTVIVFLLVVVGGVAAWTLRQTPIYRATATVQVDLRAPSVLGREVEQVEELGTGSYWNNQEYLRTQHMIIKSREVTSRVVKTLRLDEDPDFAGTGDTKRDSLEIAEVLSAEVIVEPVRDSRLIRISFDDHDPERARAIANAVTDAYLAQNRDRMLEATESARDWLGRQLDELQTELTESERALYDFRLERDILSVSLEERQNITANQMQKLSEALTTSRAHRIGLGARVAEIRELTKRDPLETPSSALIDNSLVQQLKRRHAELEEERAGLTKIYGKNWPQVAKVDSEMARIRERIGLEVTAVLESVESDYRTALRTETGIKAALQDVQTDALKLNLYELEYNSLTRDSESTAKMYDLVLGRTKETDLARFLNINNLRILDYAVLPRDPIKPRVTMILLAAVFFGLLGGIGLALLLDALDVTVKGQLDLERMGLVFLGLVPSIDEALERKNRKHRKHGNGGAAALNTDLVVHERPKSTVAESCRSIRTNLLFMSPEQELRTILITSPGPREGKTTVAISLAIVMAQGGSRVALVDLDMRRPRVHAAMRIDKEPGMSTAIMGEKTLGEVIRPTDIERLWVLPSGPVPPKPAELLHTERFAQLLAELTERFDRVVLDSPPLGAVTDAAILATKVDGVVLVAKAGATRREAIRHAYRQLKEIGGRVLGTVLNQVNLAHRAYGYYNQYYYRRKGYSYYAYGEDETSEGRKNCVEVDDEQPPAVQQ